MWGMPLPFMDETLPPGFTITNDNTPKDLAEAIKFYSSSEYDWMNFLTDRHSLADKFQEKLDAISESPFIRLCHVIKRRMHKR